MILFHTYVRLSFSFYFCGLFGLFDVWAGALRVR